MVIFIAVVAAPLTEELMFRVILQGALSRLVPPRVAIPLVAWCFCSVHGLVDGLALIPLALILGIVFHRTHNYLTVVVIHALFNATMIALQLLMVALQQTVTN
jgi:membrane protease YdiL (CAAX protease family)